MPFQRICRYPPSGGDSGNITLMARATLMVWTCNLSSGATPAATRTGILARHRRACHQQFRLCGTGTSGRGGRRGSLAGGATAGFNTARARVLAVEHGGSDANEAPAPTSAPAVGNRLCATDSTLLCVSTGMQSSYPWVVRCGGVKRRDAGWTSRFTALVSIACGATMGAAVPCCRIVFENSCPGRIGLR